MRKKNDDSRDGSTAISVITLRARGDRLAPTELQIGRVASHTVGSNPKTAARLPLSSWLRAHFTLRALDVGPPLERERFTLDIQISFTIHRTISPQEKYNWLHHEEKGPRWRRHVALRCSRSTSKLGIISRTAYTSLTKLHSTLICNRNLKLLTLVYPKLIPLIYAACDGHNRL